MVQLAEVCGGRVSPRPRVSIPSLKTGSLGLCFCKLYSSLRGSHSERKRSEWIRDKVQEIKITRQSERAGERARECEHTSKRGRDEG